MTIAKRAIGLVLIAATAAPAGAQTVSDDVRCLLLSNLFVKSPDPRGKEAASESLLYYVGRVEGRGTDQAVINAMRAQSAAITAKGAPAEMSACMQRVQQSKRRIQLLAEAAKPAGAK